MTGFSASWLALREPADHDARNGAVRDACVAHFAGHGALSITDLGCGTGSNLRALAPHLPNGQVWRLVDLDLALLAAAGEALRSWADASHEEGEGLHLIKGGKTIAVHFRQANLVNDLDAVFAEKCDLITAAALFDLCSPAWIARFTTVLVARSLPLYTVLTYNGLETWHPPHSADAAILEAFITHQQTDKGFGPASGPNAFTQLQQELLTRGYRLVTGDSAWMLGQKEAGLIAALVRGSAQAALETGMVTSAEAASWTKSRMSSQGCKIGHTDLFAAPLHS